MNDSSISLWLRAIRFRFLAASALSVTGGLVLSYLFYPQNFNYYYAALTYVGIFCLHSSVDLLNDYWDYKRGIDQITRKTKFSGGTGVLPQGLLKPRDVYMASIIFLIIGLLIGIFFVYLKGYVIALILLFATLSIILYSNKLVNLGLGELFVGIKGALVVVGSFYVQTEVINIPVVWLGIIMGLLSSFVLFINSIPDIRADKLKGRKTLAIILEEKSRRFNLLFLLSIVFAIYILTFVFFNFIMDSFYSFLGTLFFLPFVYRIIKNFKIYIYDTNEKDLQLYDKIMEKTVLFSRIYGIYLIMGILFIFILR